MSGLTPMQTLVGVENVIAVIACFILIIVCLWETIVLRNYPKNTLVVPVSVFSISFFAIALIAHCWGITHVNEQTLMKDIAVLPQIIWAVFSITWRIAQMSVYFLFLTRMNHSFATLEKYRISKRTYFLFITGIISFVIMYLIFKVIWSITCGINDQNIIKCIPLSANAKHYFWVVEHVFSMLIEGCLSITMLAIFIKRLWHLSTDCSQVIVNSDRRSLSSEENEESANIKIVHLLSKILVLSLISIISTQILLVFLALFGTSLICFRIVNILISIQCCTSAVCVFLSFDFAFPCYKKMCRPLDICCIYCCLNCFEKKLFFNRKFDIIYDIRKEKKHMSQKGANQVMLPSRNSSDDAMDLQISSMIQTESQYPSPKEDYLFHSM